MTTTTTATTPAAVPDGEPPARAERTGPSPRAVTIAAAAAAAQLEPGLDRPVRVIGSRLGAALVALLLALGAGGAWAAWGSLPNTLSLPGVLAHGAAPVLARADTAGTVLDLRVRPGDRVIRGQLLALLRTPAAGPAGTVELRSPADGTVARVLTAPGGTLTAGAALLALDPAGEPATLRLYTGSARDLARLRPGQSVLLPLPSGTVRARITAVDPYPARADALDAVLPLGGDALGTGADRVWTITAVPDAASAAALPATYGPVSVDASVDLGSRRPYQVVLGAGAGA
ncbi:HlyD family efflux transporter periplasmic adaptor subunit [Streptomyces sp. NPDC006733]|uniref:HlyD family efflux transporter periplasmic adaptor subunit n=1 Tax=Streptomyces sp. NPDC006733 TaxID=3155460 RepID=UPI0033F15949